MIMIKVKWSDKVTGKYHIIQLDKVDIKRLAKTNSTTERDIVEGLHGGRTISTDNHTYEEIA